MTRMETDEELGGPEFEMWNHLESGLDRARMELDCLSEEDRTILTKFSERIFSQRTNLIVASDDKFAALSSQLLKEPWIKFAVDIAFAEESLARAGNVFDRYVKLQPILTRYELTNLAAKCLQEAGWTFLFSFDAACVEFCKMVLEQTLRKELVDAGGITEEQSKVDAGGITEEQSKKDTVGRLLTKAREKRLLPEATEQAAKDLITMRNEVIHRRFEALEDEALNAMDQLGVVLQELGQRSAR